MNGKVNGSGARTCDTMMRDALLHALQQEVAVDGCIMSKMQAIARQLVAMALVGDMRAIKEIFDRIDGKARPAVVAREQPTEAQAGIALKEQLRQLTAWDFPPPAAVAPEQPMEAQADIGLKEQLRRLTAWDFPPPPAVAPEQPMEAQAGIGLTQRENPQAIPDVHRELAAPSEAARNGRGDEMELTAAGSSAPPSPLWRAKTLEGPDPRCFA